MVVFGKFGGPVVSDGSDTDELMQLLHNIQIGNVVMSAENNEALEKELLQRALTLQPAEFQYLADGDETTRSVAIGKDQDETPFVWRKGQPWPLDSQQLPVYAIIRQVESLQYQKTKAALSKSLCLVQEVSDAYENFMDLVGKANLLLIEMQPFSFLNCLQTCRYQLVQGSLTLLRGHYSDSAFYTRKAIELFAFVVEIFRNSEASSKWLECGLSEESAADYRKAFPIMKTLKKAKDVSGDLGARYDSLSNCVHPSFEGIAKQCKLEGRIHQFSYFDPEEDRDSGFVGLNFMNLIFTHSTILNGLGKLLKERETSFRHQAWETISEQLRERIQAEAQRWQQTANKIFAND